MDTRAKKKINSLAKKEADQFFIGRVSTDST